MKNLEELELTYKPSKEIIDALTMENYVSAHRETLGVTYVTTVCRAAQSMGVNSLRDLYEADLSKYGKKQGYYRCKGSESVLKLQSILKNELSEKES